jgi:antitoxin YxxD
VSDRDIAAAERRMGLSLPLELRTFYREVGWGFFAKGEEEAKWNRNLVNRVIPPDEIADLLLDSDQPLRPSEGFVRGALPFFELGSGTFLLLKPKSKEPNKVYHADGKRVVADSVVDFFRQLYVNAAFYKRRPA